MPTYCNDAGRPGCKLIADPRWAMRFDDIGEPPIHWCSVCGPEAHRLNDYLMRRFDEDPEGMARELGEAVKAVKPEARH